MRKLYTNLLIGFAFTLTGLDVKAEEVDTELRCLAKNVYHEARGENVDGQIAVAIVTLNRVKSKNYPNTICEVVYQKYQFSWTLSEQRIKDWRLYHEIKDLSHLVMTEKVVSVVGKSQFYHATHVTPKWASSMTKVAQIENHIFYEGK